MNSELSNILPTVNRFIDIVKADESILHNTECASVRSFIESFGGTIPPAPTSAEESVHDAVEEEDDPNLIKPESDPFPPMPETAGDDWETAGKHKEAAAEAKANGDYAKAIELYTQALMAQSSALTFANRADCLVKAQRPAAAIADCDAALKVNPDSAKALKIRGKAHGSMGHWEMAHSDLSKAMAIDFDPEMTELCKHVEAKAKALLERRTQQRVQEEEAKRKEEARKREERRRANEEARKRAEEQQQSAGGMPDMGGMPGGGMPGMGGMPAGMGGLGGIPGMDDPEILAALQNPKVAAALQGAMSGGMNPAKIMELMGDPEVGPVLQKIMAKFGGGMGGGMPGGMGGMPGGMGGMPDPSPQQPQEFDVDDAGDDVPDLD